MVPWRLQDAKTVLELARSFFNVHAVEGVPQVSRKRAIRSPIEVHVDADKHTRKEYVFVTKGSGFRIKLSRTAEVLPRHHVILKTSRDLVEAGSLLNLWGGRLLTTSRITMAPIDVAYLYGDCQGRMV